MKSLGVFLIHSRYNAPLPHTNHVEKWLILLHRLHPEASWKLGFWRPATQILFHLVWGEEVKENPDAYFNSFVKSLMMSPSV